MMKMKRKYVVLVIGICTILLINSISSVQAFGRIEEYREQKLANPRYALPSYVAGVTYEDILMNPSPQEIYSWAVDNEEWAAEFLGWFKSAHESSEVEEKETWIGDPILVIFIDFENDHAYAATFSTMTGNVEKGYQDTKTELWIDFAFVQEAIAYGDTHTEDELITWMLDHYYNDWSVWIEQGPFDIQISREMIELFIVWALSMGGIYKLYLRKKK